MNTTEIGVLVAVNTVLLGIAGFFVKQWINSVKEDNKYNRDELRLFKEESDRKFASLKSEMGKRKGETELLRKDLEMTAAESRKSFENMSIHMNYQKTSLEEIKKSITDRGASELEAILELTKKLNNEKE